MTTGGADGHCDLFGSKLRAGFDAHVAVVSQVPHFVLLAHSKSSTFKTIDEWMCADTAAEVDAADTPASRTVLLPSVSDCLACDVERHPKVEFLLPAVIQQLNHEPSVRGEKRPDVVGLVSVVADVSLQRGE